MKTIADQITAKLKSIEQCDANIAKYQAKKKQLQEEIEQLKLFEIRGILNEADMPYDEFIEKVRTSVLQLHPKKEVNKNETETA